MMTKVQVDALKAALRARLNPNERQGWCERFVLAQCKEQTLLAMERRGLVESYINPKSDKIGWRLTACGADTARVLLGNVEARRRAD